MKKNLMIAAIAAAAAVSSSCEENRGESLELSPTRETVTAGFKAGEYEMEFTTNGEWEAFTYNSWCTVSPETGSGDGKITISVQGNDGEASRATTVEVVAKLDGNKEKRLLIDVVQLESEPVLSADYQEKRIGYEAQALELLVTTNLPRWQVYLPGWCEAVSGSPLLYNDQDRSLKDVTVT